MVELKGISIYFLRERLNIDAPRARLLTEMSMIILNGLAVCFRVGYARAGAHLCFDVTVGRGGIESREVPAFDSESASRPIETQLGLGPRGAKPEVHRQAIRS